MANKRNIRKWVDALRSGKFKQTTGELSNSHGYCCLGVACELAISNGVKISKVASPSGISYGGQSSELPERVQEWLGLDDYDPKIGRDRVRATFWNDSRRASFKKIAGLIERTYLTTKRRKS